MTKEIIEISTDKIKLLINDLKEIKSFSNKKVGQELTAYKYKTQKYLLELLLKDEGLDKYIDKIKMLIHKEKLNAQAKKHLDN